MVFMNGTVVKHHPDKRLIRYGGCSNQPFHPSASRSLISANASPACCSGFVCPCPGKACKPNSFTHLRGTFS